MDEDEQDTCLICLERIHRDAAVWNCSCCYLMLHLKCAKSWMVGQQQRSALSADLFPLANNEWSCPKCRSPYSKNVALKNLCFCGKTDLSRDDLDVDHFREAHACDEMCEKKLSCGHRCTLPCHRSACPMCCRTVEVKCCCGRQSSVRRCGEASNNPSFFLTCQAVCGRVLQPCGHLCREQCHPQVCPPCEERVMRSSCWCGQSEVREERCGDAKKSCQRQCGKRLNCGRCVCRRLCHEGKCDVCVLPKCCPCGKTAYPLDVKCGDEVPKCVLTCGKTLPCGHSCENPCHAGACGECSSFARTRKCRCGKTSRAAPCDAEVRCQSRCSRMRSCGRHKCGRKCCDGKCKPCDHVCGEKLSCRNHTCEDPCHAGPCQPCKNMVSISCACTLTVVRVPCGTENVVGPPKCMLPCSYVVCHHGPMHKCHFGKCPPCEKICDKPHASCQHPCPKKCHDPLYPYVPVKPVFKQGSLFRLKVDAKAERKIAMDFGPRKPLELSKVVCDLCEVVVKRECYGKHDFFDRICHTDPKFSCGRPCGNDLKCGNHFCSLKCHVKGEECRQCDLPCQKVFPCGHSCALPCHPKSIVHPACVAPIPFSCYCGRKRVDIACNLMKDEKQVHAKRQCGGACPKALPCAHLCKKKCHNGPCMDGPCEVIVQVTCACRNLQGTMPCTQVVPLRKELGLAYDSKAVLKCNEGCVTKRNEELAKKKQEEQQQHVRKNPSAIKKKSKQQPTTTTTVTDVESVKGGSNALLIGVSIAVVTLIVMVLLHVTTM